MPTDRDLSWDPAPVHLAQIGRVRHLLVSPGTGMHSYSDDDSYASSRHSR